MQQQSSSIGSCKTSKTDSCFCRSLSAYLHEVPMVEKDAPLVQPYGVLAVDEM
jgi:hypothetical protein